MPRSAALLAIGDLSRRTGVHIETIRYYERIAMLPAPERAANGRRVYGPSAVRRLAFIRRARELGFTLDDVRLLLTLPDEEAGQMCAQGRELAERHLAEVRAKLEDLRAMERVLADMVRRCQVDGEAVGCPLIDALSSSATGVWAP